MKDRLTTASQPMERPQGSCGTCIVCWQDGINPYIISVLIRSAIAAPPPGMRNALLERPLANGTRLGAIGTALGQWNDLLPLKQSLGSTWNPAGG